MKIRIQFIMETLFFVALFIVAIFALYSTIRAWPFQLEYLAVFMILLVMAASGSCIGYNLTSGQMYYQKFYLPIDKFEVTEYKNAVTISLNGYLRTYSRNKDNIMQLNQIKVIQFYNRGKKENGYELLIYEQLLDEQLLEEQ